MPKPLSRRNFLSRATTTATVSGVLNGTLAEAETEADGAPPPTAASLPPYKPTVAQMALAYERARAYDEQTRAPVLNARIVPHWFGANDATFWYRRDGHNGTRTFVLIKAEIGEKGPAFDHARLAQNLGRLAGVPLDADRLPFANIALSDDLKTLRVALRGQTYACDLTTYECVKSDVPLPAETVPPPGPPTRRGRRSGGQNMSAAPSPWELFLKDNNVWVRPRGKSSDAANAEAVALSTTGTAEKPFVELRRAPGGAMAVAYHKTDVPILPVYKGNRHRRIPVRSARREQITERAAFCTSTSTPSPATRFRHGKCGCFPPAKNPRRWWKTGRSRRAGRSTQSGLEVTKVRRVGFSLPCPTGAINATA